MRPLHKVRQTRKTQLFQSSSNCEIKAWVKSRIHCVNIYGLFAKDDENRHLRRQSMNFALQRNLCASVNFQ